MKYQYRYARISPQMSDFKQRKEKALKILAIIDDFLAHKFLKKEKFICLEIGCSLGGMTRIFAFHFKKIIALDIDTGAIETAQESNVFRNITFKIGDALNLDFKDGYFDLVICNNVYEHVPDASRMMKEIYRVLKKNGICYFAGPNKYTPMESDHNLPFLSWLPKSWGSFYLKVTGRGDYYYEITLSHSELLKLTSIFEVYDYTLEILKKPKKFRATHKFQEIIRYLPTIFLRPLLPFLPSFFWVLVKKEGFKASPFVLRR